MCRDSLLPSAARGGGARTGNDRIAGRGGG